MFTTRLFDLSQATSLLNISLILFKELRLNEPFDSIILETENVVTEVELEKYFGLNTPRHCIRIENSFI